MSYRLYNSGNVLVFVDTAHTIKNGGTQFWIQKLPKNKTWYSYDNTAAPILYSVYYDEPERDLIIDAQYGEFQYSDGTVFSSDAELIAYLDNILGVTPTDLMLSIAKGDVYGQFPVNKFGANSLIATDTQEDIWDGGGDYSYPANGVAPITNITSTNAGDTGNVEVQGLDILGNKLTQTKALSGTAKVDLDTPLFRVFRMKNVGTASFLGIVTADNAAENVTYAIMQIGNNQTLMALYTVPNGYTAFMTSIFFSNIDGANKTPTAVEIKMWAADRGNGGVFQLKHADAMPKAGSGRQHNFRPYYKFNQMTDIRMSGQAIDEPGHVHAGFDLIVIKN